MGIIILSKDTLREWRPRNPSQEPVILTETDYLEGSIVEVPRGTLGFGKALQKIMELIKSEGVTLVRP